MFIAENIFQFSKFSFQKKLKLIHNHG